MGLSRRAYARHRGVTENAVRAAIAAGRITLEPDGTIYPVKADKDWTEKTDPAKQRGVHAAIEPRAAVAAAPVHDKPVSRTALDAVQRTLQDSSAKKEGDVTFLRARTANEVIKVQERGVRLAKIKGELVDRACAVATIFGLARCERDAWVQWPARVSALMAAELRVEPHQMETVLEKYVRRHLTELADVKFELR